MLWMSWSYKERRNAEKKKRIKESLKRISFFQTHLRVTQMPSGERIKFSNAHVLSLETRRRLELFIFRSVKREEREKEEPIEGY